MSTKKKVFLKTASDQFVGDEVTGIDIAGKLNNVIFKKIEARFNRVGVIYFRSQKLSEIDHINFTKRFGDVGKNTFASYAAHPKFPDEILVISNIIKNGQLIGNPDAGHTWHTDQSYTKRPPRATILYALEIPKNSSKNLGDTLYANTAFAYDALPKKIKKSLIGLKAVHRMSSRKRGGDAPKRVSATLKNKYPDVVHPIVRTHPFTGRKSLYVREGECIAILGMPDDEAVSLIKELSNHIISNEFIYRHKWEVGDLIIWDNCTVQHLAIKDYSTNDRRHLHRTVVQGEEPF